MLSLLANLDSVWCLYLSVYSMYLSSLDTRTDWAEGRNWCGQHRIEMAVASRAKKSTTKGQRSLFKLIPFTRLMVSHGRTASEVCCCYGWRGTARRYDCTFTSPRRGVQNIMMSMYVYLSVCLSARINWKTHGQTSPNFCACYPMAVARSSSGGIAIRYKLPVL